MSSSGFLRVWETRVGSLGSEADWENNVEKQGQEEIEDKKGERGIDHGPGGAASDSNGAIGGGHVALVQQYAKVPQPEGAMIIDSRPYKPKYANGHIPTAVSIPDSQFDKLTDKLPADKNTLLIFYCGGPA